MSQELIQFIKSSPKFQAAIDEVLCEYFSQEHRFSPPTIHEITTMVSNYFRVPVEIIRGKNRRREYTAARHLSMYFAKQYTGASLKVIGNYFGGKDHTSVIHACHSITLMLETEDPLIKNAFLFVEPKIKTHQANLRRA